jgi:hypothetical protein
MSTLIVDSVLDLAGFDIVGARDVVATRDINAGNLLGGSGLNIPLITHDPLVPNLLFELTHEYTTWPATTGVWETVYDIVTPDIPTGTPHGAMGALHIGFGAEVNNNHASGISDYRVIDSSDTVLTEWLGITGTTWVDLAVSPAVTVSPGETLRIQRRRNAFAQALIRNPKLYGVPAGAVSFLGDSGSITTP